MDRHKQKVKEFGITVHYVDEGIDTGDIILQKSFQITDQDNYKYIKVDSIEQVSEGVEAVQIETTASYFLERYLVK